MLEPGNGIVSKKLKRKELYEQVKLAKKGDQQAFEAVLAHLCNYIVAICKEFYIQGAESQDVFQECMIKLMNIIETFDESKGSFVSFAQAGFRKHIITTLNKEHAKKRVILNQCFSLDNPTTESDEDSEFSMTKEEKIDKYSKLKSKIGNPLDLVQRDYEEYIIEKISEVLSDLETKVFILRFIKDLSYKEIAAELGLYKQTKKKRMLDQKSVDNAIWRSRPKIKKVLEKLNIRSHKIDKIIDEVEEKHKPEVVKKVIKTVVKKEKKVNDTKPIKIVKKVLKPTKKVAKKAVKKLAKKVTKIVKKITKGEKKNGKNS